MAFLARWGVVGKLAGCAAMALTFASYARETCTHSARRFIGTTVAVDASNANAEL